MWPSFVSRQIVPLRHSRLSFNAKLHTEPFGDAIPHHGKPSVVPCFEKAAIQCVSKDQAQATAWKSWTATNGPRPRFESGKRPQQHALLINQASKKEEWKGTTPSFWKSKGCCQSCKDPTGKFAKISTQKLSQPVLPGLQGNNYSNIAHEY